MAMFRPAATFSHESSEHKQRLAVSQSEGNEESSSVLHTTEVSKHRRSVKGLRLIAEQTLPGESEKKVPERRVTSPTGAETVTGGTGGIFRLFVLFFSSLKGSCVVNNTVAFIPTGDPLCVL